MKATSHRKTACALRSRSWHEGRPTKCKRQAVALQISRLKARLFGRRSGGAARLRGPVLLCLPAPAVRSAPRAAPRAASPARQQRRRRQSGVQAGRRDAADAYRSLGPSPPLQRLEEGLP
eukprot:3884188-Pleurochrysis_carterae.AAC.1